MHNILLIFRRDVVRILKNPVAVVVTLGVAVIPALYAWFNILANWDPYGNTGSIAVAVANDDAGADVEGQGHVDIGQAVVDALKDNHRLGWTFVDRDEALSGVDSGRYYAAIVIPEDFSADLASVVTGKLDRPKLEYYVNEKLNAVAPKVTDSGASAVESTVNEQFVSTVTDVVAERAKALAGDVADGTQGAAGSASARIREAEDDLRTIAGLVDETRGTCASAVAATQDAQGVLDGLSSTVSGSAGTLGSALSQLTEARAQARTLSRDLDDALVGGATTVAGISSTASHDIGALAGDIGGAQATVDSATAQLQSAQDSLSQAKQRLDQAVADLPSDGPLGDRVAELKRRLQEQSARIQEQLDAQQQALDRLGELSSTVRNAASAAGSGAAEANDAVQAAADGLLATRRDLSQDALPKADEAMDDFSGAGSTLQGLLSSLATSIEGAKGSLSQLTATVEQADGALANTREALDGAMGTLDSLSADLSAVTSSQAFDALRSMEGVDAGTLADFMGSPVSIEERAVYPVANYGSGVTPFYTDLALFVGGFVLVSIYKLEVDREGLEDLKPWEAYFGRWLLLFVVGVLQAVITCVGDLVLGIQCVSPVAFVFAGIVESFVYVNMIYALAVAFKHVGKALAVLIVILQIPGSSGLYPIQMQPDFFRALSPWLPFTYGNNAMREAIAGFYDGHYGHDLLMLLLFVVPSLLVGVVLRRYLLNINRLFDAKLRDTDLMICERTEPPEAHFRLATLLKAALDQDSYRKVFEERCTWFNAHYQAMVRVGFRCLVLCSTVLLVPMFVAGPEVKFVVLVVWICAILALICFLVTVEYLHERMNEKTDLTTMPRDRLLEMVGESLNHEVAPIAPFSKMGWPKKRLARLLERDRGGDDALGDGGAKGGDGR